MKTCGGNGYNTIRSDHCFYGNAAMKVVKNIDFERFNSFTIVYGTGNNGGDSLAVAY